MKIIFTKHSKEMILHRDIDKKLIRECALTPDMIVDGDDDKKIYLKNFGKNYLKLVIALESNGLVIITAHWLAKKRVKL